MICELVVPCSSYGQVSLTIEENNDQKKQLTPEDYLLWESVFLRKISNNGEWVSYTIKYATDKDTLFVKNTKANVIYKIPNAHHSGTFSTNSKYFCYKVRGKSKSVGYINLNTGFKTEIQEAINFVFSASGHYLAVHIGKDESVKETKQHSLLIVDLIKGTSHEIKNVSEYGFNENETLVYIVKNETSYFVALMNLKKTNEPPKIIASNPINYYHRLIWDENRKSFAFMEAFKEETFKEDSHMVHHYHKETLYSFNPRVNKEFPKQMYVSGSRFSKFLIYEDSPKVFFCIAPYISDEEENKKLKNITSKSNVQVWSWKDKEIYPKLKNAEECPVEPLLSIWDPFTNAFMQIINQEEKVLSGSSRYILTCRPQQYRPIFKYVDDYIDIFITDLTTGKKELFLEKQLNRANHTLYASKGHYISYFKNKHWWVYDIKKKTHTNITKNLPYPTYRLKSTGVRFPKPYGNPGWTENNNANLIYDQFDIWRISPDGKRQERLTNGRDLKKRYRIYDKQYTNRKYKDHSFFKSNSFNLNEELIFSIYGENTKKSGYASWNIKKGVHNIMYADKHIDKLKKAKNNDTYIVREQDFDMPPKLVRYSEDQKTEIVQSNPQHYNFTWGRSELIKYLGINRDPLQGVLFYPANYQVGKKYPMITYIYEKMSQELHKYVNPSFEISYGFNPTNYTTNDYFVLYPDITYEYNEPGISATKCVTNAVDKVLELGFIENENIGLIGHSFGGYETTFILTQTDLFATGVAGSAPVDLVSMYLGIYHNDYSDAEYFENYQMRFTGSFYQYPDAYLRNSPIHNLNKINSSLLSWHGEKDGRVNISQSIELYSAMRRLGKPHKFLVYPNGFHTLRNPIDQIDLSKKIMHWFDYKLKGEKPKLWILIGNLKK
ncbi:MAG: prolyl oligopeptidase family serine peptidase [Cellulophaga sp.]